MYISIQAASAVPWGRVYLSTWNQDQELMIRFDFFAITGNRSMNKIIK